MQIEKTVFISYRRKNVYHARAVFEWLRCRGYDVFMDYENLGSGAFNQNIINQINARGHFIIILTHNALKQCADSGDMLRREIEAALKSKRNIIPLMMEGFDWRRARNDLVDTIKMLPNYQALPIHAVYFDAGMEKLCADFLNMEIDAVLHPISKTDISIAVTNEPLESHIPVLNEKLSSAYHYFQRGFSYQQSEEYEGAIGEYTKAIEIDPKHVDAYNNRGNIYKQKRDYAAAISDYNAAIQLNPNYAMAYNNRGNVYYSQGEHNRAIQDFAEAIRINPNYAEAYNNRGNIYYTKENYEQALADFNRAIHINPNYPMAYNNRGNVFSIRKMYDEAIKDYDRAIHLAPGFELARKNREIAIRKRNQQS